MASQLLQRAVSLPGYFYRTLVTQSPKEIKIPVPWGFVAAKIWGDDKDEPVISLHGYKHNAGSFDTLIPLLPKGFCYICIDLPSHGRSSHLDTKSIPTHLDFVLTLKLLLDYFNRKEYILLGHSVSMRFGPLFTIMYPEYIRAMIALDASFYIPIEAKDIVKYYREIIDEYIKQEKNKYIKSAPTYSFDEAAKRLLVEKDLTEDSAKILLKRWLIPVEDEKYKFSTARHLNYSPRFPFSMEYVVELFKQHPVTCPHLIILVSDREYKLNSRLNELIAVYKKNDKCQVYFIDGQHNIHLDHPERIAPILNKFLLSL